MNKFLLICCALTLGACAPSAKQEVPSLNIKDQLVMRNQVKWHHNLDESALTSLETNKPILMFFHSRYCSWCLRMMMDTFSDPTLANKINSNFVPLLIDAPRDDLTKDLGISATPTIVVVRVTLEAKVNTLGKNVGFIESKELLGFLNQCLARVPR